MNDPFKVKIAIVGTGYRARLLRRIAAAFPDRFEVTGVLSRHPQDKVGFEVAGVSALLNRHPDFVVTAVPAEHTPKIIEDLVERGQRVLAETPPAADESALRELWNTVGATGRVQVAEQYPRHPLTAARIAAVRTGCIGDVTSASVSLAQTYHAVAVLRAVLGAGHSAAEVRATRHVAPLVQPFGRGGWTGDLVAHPAATTSATIDFGGQMGIYDFTDGQTRNPLRRSRFFARGSQGEIVGERLARIADHETVIESDLLRRDVGMHHDFEDRELLQISLDGEVLWRNRFLGARFSDEELAIVDLLEATGAWAVGEGEAPYPLAEAAQDHLLGLAIERAAVTGLPVATPGMHWQAE